MIGAVVPIALLALGVVAAVAWPLVRGRVDDLPVIVEDPARIALEDEIAASLAAIKELQFDHQAGNISDADFNELDRAERANAARLIRRRSEFDDGS